MPLYSTDETSRVSTYGGMLPRSGAAPIPEQRLPQFRWPAERHLTPTHCQHCGATLLRGDTPTAEHPLVDVCCLMCSRTACELISDAAPRRLTAAEWAAIPVNQPQRGRPRRVLP